MLNALPFSPLITRAVATAFAAAGARVYGTSRDPERAAMPPGVTPLRLDVRSDESAAACVAAVLAAAGRLDVVVNNAGVSLVGAAEDTTAAEAAALFDTNVFGVHRVARPAALGADYAAPLAVAERVLLDDIDTGDAPAAVAAVVLRAAADRRPRARYLAGRGARRMRLLRSLLPAAAFDRGLRRRFGLDRTAESSGSEA